MSLTYREFRSYSIRHGYEVARLSVADERGAEFFTHIPIKGAGSWRDRRSAAIDRVVDAIERGDSPGEVTDQSTPVQSPTCGV